MEGRTSGRSAGRPDLQVRPLYDSPSSSSDRYAGHGRAAPVFRERAASEARSHRPVPPRSDRDRQRPRPGRASPRPEPGTGRNRHGPRGSRGPARGKPARVAPRRFRDPRRRCRHDAYLPDALGRAGRLHPARLGGGVRDRLEHGAACEGGGGGREPAGASRDCADGSRRRRIRANGWHRRDPHARWRRTAHGTAPGVRCRPSPLDGLRWSGPGHGGPPSRPPADGRRPRATSPGCRRRTRAGCRRGPRSRASGSRPRGARRGWPRARSRRG